MTDISVAATAARESARHANGQFGAQDHTAPEANLQGNPAVTVWAEAIRAADENVDALIPIVEGRFRDLIRAQHPDASTVSIGLSYDTDGDALVYLSEIDGEEVDDDGYLDEAISTLRAYGYCHERLDKMSCTVGSDDHFTFDLDRIDGESLPEAEFDETVRAAWDEWDESATLIPAIADEAGRRLGMGELTFQFTDTDDDRRVTLHGPDGDEIEEPDLLGAMNAYVTARADMRLFPGVEQDQDDEWTFRYRVGRA